ncbi:hypothetical protein EH2_00230 [Bacillus subtilis]|nr:hypothetical protein EH2_00230 [Bacillus subtilis]
MFYKLLYFLFLYFICDLSNSNKIIILLSISVKEPHNGSS